MTHTNYKSEDESKKYSTYKMNITELPLEILEKVTLLLRNIWDLECWLTCAYMLEDFKTIQIKRCALTIEKGKEDKRRVEILYNTKFISDKLCKRRKRKFEGLFDNFLLVGDVKERNTCLMQWRNIFDKESYENFMIKYKDKWINKAPITKPYRKHRINRKHVIN